MRFISTLAVSAVAAAAQSPYDQCGGMSYAGPTNCPAGYTCTTYNPYYAQCYPSTPAATPKPTPSSSSSSSAVTVPPVTTTTTTTTKASSTKAPTTALSSSTGVSSPTPTTLQSGWYWIRAVAAPNFHSYLQGAAQPTAPASSSLTALISSAASAGQFNVVSGQLVWNRGNTQYYLHVENAADKTQRTLRTWFEPAVTNPYGVFAFQGDTLTWSAPDLARPNVAAWLVCGDAKELFVNTGAYLYNTPAGCADQTIHSYGGSTADV
ncbi:hypothetical protein B0T26DRAFT_757421 [Lasiosphaeria miniovina]|uniref:CBM1 domain-containing protein n=1 Tax=Lasiosphaeria miniovina TaxID=1954250 RepID=A0AA40DI10_9PEZI|nr:uncharacterized protein B0T26DRAFT_757421 [Lasiosphaeria miniovina]KAK0703925.1 hypothetical protein B0T26DRAFT_757421 [Lasiosphaeria miniovina]